MRRNGTLLVSILALLAAFALFICAPSRVLAEDYIASGTWGTCPWEISTDGTLTVHPGEGASQEGLENSPWKEHAGSISAVVFAEEDGKKVVAPADSSYLFLWLNHAFSIDLSGFDTSHVTSMGYLFASCTGLASLDLSPLDTSNVTDMGGMFSNCSSLTSLDLSPLDTSSVTDISEMFYGCTGLTSLDLSPLDTSNVTCMKSMFNRCTGLASLDLSPLNTVNVTDISYMFYGCSGLASLDLSPLDTSNVTDIRGMVSDCTRLASLDLSFFDTSNVTDMSYMFYNCTGLTSLDLSPLDTSNVTRLNSMFSNCSGLTSLDLSPLDTSNVDSMQNLFSNCSGLTSLDLSSLNTSNVTTFSSMFSNCSNLTSIDLSSFDVRRFPDLSRMFYGCSKLETILVNVIWPAEFDRSGRDMFKGCLSLVGGNGTVYDPNHIDGTYARIDADGAPGYLTSITLDNVAVGKWGTCPWEISWDGILSVYPGTGASQDGKWRSPWKGYEAYVTSVVFISENGEMVVAPSDSSYLLEGFSNVVSVDLSGLDTSNVTNMHYMFCRCSKLASLDLSPLDTSNVTDMGGLFTNCSSLTSLDLSPLDTSNVTDFSMFSGCSGLTSLDLSPLDTSSATDMGGMFANCTGLASLDLSPLDTSNVTNMTGMFFHCHQLSFFDLSSFNTVNVTGMTDMFKDCWNLQTIYVGRGWSTKRVVESHDMFYGCGLLVGGDGTAYTEDHTDVLYARVDSSKTPGYLTDRTTSGIDINNATVTGIEETYVFNGSARGIRPVPVVTYNGRTLVEGIDYEVAYQDNLYAGRTYGSDDHLAFAIISGKGQFGEGEFKGFKFVGFSIVPAPMSDATIEAIPGQFYTGTAIEPAVTVKLGNMTLVEGFDYTVSYADNTDPGIATVTVTGTDEGNLTGSVTTTFTISDVIVDDGVASFSDGSRAYLLDLDAPAGVTVRAGEDEREAYRPPYTDGEGSLYCWPDASSEFFVEIPCEHLVSGFALSPAGAGLVRWDADRDAFEVSLTAPATLKISMERIEYVPASENPPTGVAVDVPSSVVDEFDGITLAVEERTGDAVEDAKVVISQYSEDGFTLDDAVLLDIHYEDEAGSEIPAPTEANGVSMKVTLPVPDGWDASKVRVYYMETSVNPDGVAFTYPQDMNATPTADGKSVVFYTTHFSDYAMAYDMDAFPARVDLSRAAIDPIPVQDYSGDEIEPQVKMTLDGLELAEIVDYSVSYRDNIGPGVATIIIEGAGNYAGVISTTFEIVSDEPQSTDISGATIAPIPDQAFTGRPIIPAFEVSLGETVLIAGTDYRVTYKYNVDPGTAVVVVEGIGGYAGTVKGVFTILQPVNPFRDVAEQTGHFEDILWLASSGISRGWDMDDGTFEFRPYASVARADMAAFLCRLVNGSNYKYEPTSEDVTYFADVNWSTPHCREIWWLANQGISRGWVQGGKHYFRPYGNVARCDMACFLMRMALGSDAEESYTPHPAYASYFSDVDAGTSHRNAVLWLAAERVSQGWGISGGRHEFRPYSNVARADMAAFLHRMMKYGLVSGGNVAQTQ